MADHASSSITAPSLGNNKVGCACTIIGSLIMVGLTIFACVRYSRTSSDSSHLSFSITQASVSSFNLSPTHLHANFSLVASLKNPDKNSYDDVHAALFYGTTPTIIAETSLESFSMEQENNAPSLVKYINLVAHKELDPTVASAIARDQAVNSTVGFALNFSARDRGTTGRRTEQVWCQGIIINFGNTNETMGIMKNLINCDAKFDCHLVSHCLHPV